VWRGDEEGGGAGREAERRRDEEEAEEAGGRRRAWLPRVRLLLAGGSGFAVGGARKFKDVTFLVSG
jgi:hypothetical protein